MLDKNTDGNAQYRTPGQTVAQWHNGGVLVGGKKAAGPGRLYG